MNHTVLQSSRRGHWQGGWGGLLSNLSTHRSRRQPTTAPEKPKTSMAAQNRPLARRPPRPNPGSGSLGPSGLPSATLPAVPIRPCGHCCKDGLSRRSLRRVRNGKWNLSGIQKECKSAFSIYENLPGDSPVESPLESPVGCVGRVPRANPLRASASEACEERGHFSSVAAACCCLRFASVLPCPFCRCKRPPQHKKARVSGTTGASPVPWKSGETLKTPQKKAIQNAPGGNPGVRSEWPASVRRKPAPQTAAAKRSTEGYRRQAQIAACFSTLASFPFFSGTVFSNPVFSSTFSVLTGTPTRIDDPGIDRQQIQLPPTMRFCIHRSRAFFPLVFSQRRHLRKRQYSSRQGPPEASRWMQIICYSNQSL